MNLYSSLLLHAYLIYDNKSIKSLYSIKFYFYEAYMAAEFYLIQDNVTNLLDSVDYS